MSKSKIVVVFGILVFIGVVVLLTSQTSKDQASESKKENNIKVQQIEKEKQISDMKKVLKRSLKEQVLLQR